MIGRFVHVYIFRKCCDSGAEKSESDTDRHIGKGFLLSWDSLRDAAVFGGKRFTLPSSYSYSGVPMSTPLSSLCHPFGEPAICSLYKTFCPSLFISNINK